MLITYFISLFSYYTILITADDFPSLISTNASLAVVLDREFLDKQYESVLGEVKLILERVLREDLKNGGLIVNYYSWTKINYKQDFTAVFSITNCIDTWSIFEEAKEERLMMIALTEPHCPRLPLNLAIHIPLVTPGEELPQVILDTKSANGIRWKAAIILHDETFGRDMVSKVVTSLTQESPEGYIQPSAISMFKLSSQQHEWDRKKDVRKTLKNLPTAFIGTNFLAIVTLKTMQSLMEISMDLGLVNTFTQWLYIVSDTSSQKENISMIAPFIGEGSNIAFAYNTTNTEENCTHGIKCHCNELLTAFILGLSKMIKNEQVVYGQISDEEWEVIRPSKNERRDHILDFMKIHLKETSKCDNCTSWKMKAGNVWGSAYDAQSSIEQDTYWNHTLKLDASAKLVNVGYWSPVRGLSLQDVIFPHTSEGFRGKTFNIITYHNPPWQIIRYNETGHASLSASKGVVLDILKSISQRLNFTYTLHISTTMAAAPIYNFSIDDLHNSTQDIHLLTSNIPTDVFQMLHENRVLLAAVAATVNSKYEKYLSFTMPISIQPYSLLTSRPKELSRVFLFLAPFTGETWACLFVAMLLIAPILYVINQLSPYYNHHGNILKGGLAKIENCFWYVYGALLQQGGLPEYLPNADSGRIVVGTWWIVVIVIATTYCGNLVAFLTFPKIAIPITTVSQLISHRGSITWGMQVGTFLEDFLKETNEPKYRTLFEKTQFYPEENSQIIQSVREGRHIYNDKGAIREEYLFAKEFKKRVTGQKQFQAIKEFYKENKIPLTNIVDVACDGCVTNIGRKKGVVARLRKYCPMLRFTHCAAHHLALAAGLASEMQDTLSVAKKLINLLKNQASNARLLEDLCKEYECLYINLLYFNKVRWLSAGESLKRINILFLAISGMLDSLEDSSQAKAILQEWTDNKFQLSHIDWKTNLQYIMKREFFMNDQCDFNLAAEEFLEEQIAIIVPKSSPYLKLIDREIKILHQMGFIELWLREYLPKKDRCWIAKEASNVDNHTVNLMDMEGCFLVLLFGILLSVILISIECCWFNRKLYMKHKMCVPFVN